MRYILSSILVMAQMLFSNMSLACSSFAMQRDGITLFAKSYDWHTGSGIVILNKQNMMKQSLVLNEEDRPLTWISRHPSVTFNQYGAEFPNGGVNDKGLAIEVLWLNSGETPEPDSRPVVNELQWIQYNLDMYSTVDEVIRTAREIRVSEVYAKVHYLVCDKSADCAVFEYLDGELKISPKTNAITNNSFKRSNNYIKRYVGYGGDQAIPANSLGSLQRYVRIRHLADNPTRDLSITPVKEAFDILETVKVGRDSHTKWQIVYDLTNEKAFFKTADNNYLKTFDLFKYDKSCNTPRMYIDMNDRSMWGDVNTKFKALTPAINLDVVKKGLRRTMPDFPGKDRLVKGIAGYPFQLKCADSLM